MRCPACLNPFTQLLVGDIPIDACEGGCGGVWLNRFEIKKLNHLNNDDIQALLDIAKNEEVKVNTKKRRRCPKCKTIVMLRHFFSIKKELMVDECPKCGGYWLDAGELAKIRHEFSSDQAREAAAEEYFSEIFKQYGIEKKPEPPKPPQPKPKRFWPNF